MELQLEKGISMITEESVDGRNTNMIKSARYEPE
jgi:hypothetical protein